MMFECTRESDTDNQRYACYDALRKSNGGEPVELSELREFIEEAPEHDESMQNDLARPENYVVHPNEGKSFVRAPSVN